MRHTYLRYTYIRTYVSSIPTGMLREISLTFTYPIAYISEEVVLIK